MEETNAHTQEGRQDQKTSPVLRECAVMVHLPVSHPRLEGQQISLANLCTFISAPLHFISAPHLRTFAHAALAIQNTIVHLPHPFLSSALQLLWLLTNHPDT